MEEDNLTNVLTLRAYTWLSFVVIISVLAGSASVCIFPSKISTEENIISEKKTTTNSVEERIEKLKGDTIELPQYEIEKQKKRHELKTKYSKRVKDTIKEAKKSEDEQDLLQLKQELTILGFTSLVAKVNIVARGIWKKREDSRLERLKEEEFLVETRKKYKHYLRWGKVDDALSEWTKYVNAYPDGKSQTNGSQESKEAFAEINRFKEGIKENAEYVNAVMLRCGILISQMKYEEASRQYESILVTPMSKEQALRVNAHALLVGAATDLIGSRQLECKGKNLYLIAIEGKYDLYGSITSGMKMIELLYKTPFTLPEGEGRTIHRLNPKLISTILTNEDDRNIWTKTPGRLRKVLRFCAEKGKRNKAYYRVANSLLALMQRDKDYIKRIRKLGATLLISRSIYAGIFGKTPNDVLEKAYNRYADIDEYEIAVDLFSGDSIPNINEIINDIDVNISAAKIRLPGEKYVPSPHRRRVPPAFLSPKANDDIVVEVARRYMFEACEYYVSPDDTRQFLYHPIALRHLEEAVHLLTGAVASNNPPANAHVLLEKLYLIRLGIYLAANADKNLEPASS